MPLVLRMWATMAVVALILVFGWRAMALPAAPPQMFAIHFYQQVVGDLDGRSCPSYPVCSRYARQALSEQGWLVGSWLVLDRLIHEADDLRRGPWMVFKGERRLHDPLHRNSFWLQTSGRKE